MSDWLHARDSCGMILRTIYVDKIYFFDLCVFNWEFSLFANILNRFVRVEENVENYSHLNTAQYNKQKNYIQKKIHSNCNMLRRVSGA